MILYLVPFSLLVTSSLQQNVQISLSFKPPPVTASVNFSYLPDGSVCGFGSEITEDDTNQYPWIAALKYTSDNGEDGGYRCGGTLINKEFILTAAECLNIEGYKLTGVRLGQTPYSDDIVIKKMVAHPHYSSNNQQNNIGLIRLEKEVTFDDQVRPVCLYPLITRKQIHGKFMQFSGWTENGKCYGPIGSPIMESYKMDPDTKRDQYFQDGIVGIKTECGYQMDPYYIVRISSQLGWLSFAMET